MSLENMEKRLELEKRGRQTAEIKELNLDNCRSTQIFGLTDEFTNLVTLSLINVGLTTLKGFPNLPNLKRLELSDNRLCGNLSPLSGCPKLTYLNLSGNKIKDLEALSPLKELPELKNLDLFNCEVTSIDNYREKVFETIPALVYLDGFDKDDMECEEEEEDGEDDSADDDGSENGLNGNGDHNGAGEEEDDDDDDEDDEDEDDEDEDDEEDDDEVGLSYLQKSGLENEDSEGEDFEPNGDVDDDDEDDDEDESGEEDENDAAGAGETKEKSPAVERGRGIKRKRAADDGVPSTEDD